MEYARHGPLDRIAKNLADPFPWRRRIRILLDVAMGL
jgi:hypothetical protein